MPGFYSLPAEIQSMILNFVAEPSPASSKPHTESSSSASSSLARYACVDKFWNTFFESRTFKNLTITQYDISSLSRFVTGRRRSLLKHLWLRIKLPEYPTSMSKADEDPTILWQLDFVFTESIKYLWEVLSEWQGAGQKGMTLELSADSSSDWAGMLRWNSSIERDVKLYKEYLASSSMEQYDIFGDVHTPYVKLHEALSTPSAYITYNKRNDYWFATVNNLFGWRPLDFNYSESANDKEGGDEDDIPQLPPVSVVTKFLIRRQQFREIYPTALNKILSSLPAVEDVHVERWRCGESCDEKSWCKEAQVTFAMDLPPSVKTLSLYGDTSPIFHNWGPRDASVVSLAKCLRQYSKNLEHLSVSHLIDAKEFLRPFWPADSDEATRSLPDWENLKTLSLTSDVFNTGTKKEINNLLCAAARAAKKMPNLQLLELWNGKEKRACVFRYRVEDTVGEITLRGTHIKTLDNEVVMAWGDTSVHIHRPDVRESFVPIEKEDINSTRQVLGYLSNRGKIMHPVSAYRAIGKRKRGDSEEDDMAVPKKKRNDTK